MTKGSLSSFQTEKVLGDSGAMPRVIVVNDLGWIKLFLMTLLLTFLTKFEIIEHREETLYCILMILLQKVNYLMVSEAGPNFLTPIVMKGW